MDDKEKNERLIIWKSLSEFFLDTELNELDYERIAKILTNSNFSIGELQNILYYEVYPACKWNMFSTAGEWIEINTDWIMKNIAPRINRKTIFRIKPFHKWMFRDHWFAVTKLIKK